MKTLQLTKKTTILAATCLAFACGITATAQEIPPQDLEKFKIMEDSLVLSADSMFNAFLADARPAYAERFARQLVRTLRIPNSYLYKFDTLGKVVNIVYADDNAFRIFNWGIEPTLTSMRYYGAIQMAGPTLKLVGLNDYSNQFEGSLEDSVLPANRWFGALYYRIMAREVGGQKIYTLFGLNSGSMVSNRKVLDALVFTPSGVSFGAPIFGVGSKAIPGQPVKRFVLEYKKEATATMNWDVERNMIIFDKLVSVTNDPTRRYTYVPSGQYDGFVWGNEMWNFRRDLMEIKMLKDGEAPDE